MKWLDEVSGGREDFKMRFQEIGGAILSNDRKYKKIIFFNGVPNSGKSLSLNMLKDLVGKEFTSGLNLMQLGERFGTSALYRKRLNINGESSDIRASSVEILKSLSGNDLITAEFKGKDHFDFVNKAMLVFAANKPITIQGGNADQALLNRFLVLRFNNSIPTDRQDPELLEKLKEEYPAIAFWFVRGYERLAENEYMFTEVEDSDNIYDFVNDDNKDLNEFFNMCFELDMQSKTPTETIKSIYNKYCRENSMPPLAESRLHDFIQNSLHLKRDRFQLNGEQTRGYIGIRPVVDLF